MPPFDRDDTAKGDTAGPSLRLVSPADIPSGRGADRKVVTTSLRMDNGDAPTRDAAGRLAEASAVENRAASRMGADDARWAMAARVAMNLEGGRAGILRPEVRERLVGSAVRLGLRPFDANLIIAIVQDSARTGRGPLGPVTESRLRLVREADSKAADDSGGLWQLVVAAVALAGALTSMLIFWARGG